MRSRLKLHCKALLTAAQFTGMALALTFFFYDGPLHPPELISSALATNNTPKLKESVAPLDQALTASPFLIASKHPLTWKQQSLDGESVKLQVLQTPLILGQTTQQSGLEAFDYAASLYGQMAKQVKNKQLAKQLHTLQLNAQAMGQAIRQASEISFNGPPTEDMEHLQVRTILSSYVGQLNTDSQITARYNHQGQLLEEQASVAKAGQALLSYQRSLQTLLENPAAQQYPDTMRFIQQESGIIAQLAQHLTLRWESVHYCPKQCQDASTEMRIYMHQTLPADTLASAAL